MEFERRSDPATVSAKYAVCRDCRAAVGEPDLAIVSNAEVVLTAQRDVAVVVDADRACDRCGCERVEVGVVRDEGTPQS